MLDFGDTYDYFVQIDCMAWLALTAWIPFIGDVIAIALGFYKTRPLWTTILLLVGKSARFLIWNLIYGLF